MSVTIEASGALVKTSDGRVEFQDIYGASLLPVLSVAMPDANAVSAYIVGVSSTTVLVADAAAFQLHCKLGPDVRVSNVQPSAVIEIVEDAGDELRISGLVGACDANAAVAAAAIKVICGWYEGRLRVSSPQCRWLVSLAFVDEVWRCEAVLDGPSPEGPGVE